MILLNLACDRNVLCHYIKGQNEKSVIDEKQSVTSTAKDFASSECSKDLQKCRK